MRKLAGTTKVERILFGSLPEAYPKNHDVVGVEQVPLLQRRDVNDIPIELVAFDDTRRAKSQSEAGLHFFRDDRKFVSILLSPEKKAKEFSLFKVILTPDVSIGDGMPPWQRARNVVLGRAAGVVWEKRGFKVIPTHRWISDDDLQLVACGVPQRSVFAVSSYMSRRNPADLQVFSRGLRYLVNALEPVAVIVYGSLDEELFADLSKHCEVFVYADPISQERRKAKSEDSNGSDQLFS